MIIHNGDHAQYEIDNVDVSPRERSEWPLPSFDARDWAEAMHKRFPAVSEEDLLGWCANMLMRGYDQRAARISELERQDEVHWKTRGSLIAERDHLRELVSLQATDEMLWATGVHIETAYAQQALRYLTRAIEGEWTFEVARDAIKEMMP